MSKKKREDALAWLVLQGNKAMQNQNRKELETVSFIHKELSKPEYEKEILKARKFLNEHSSINLNMFCKIFTNPNTKPKTINQKANK